MRTMKCAVVCVVYMGSIIKGYLYGKLLLIIKFVTVCVLVPISSCWSTQIPVAVYQLTWKFF